MDISKSGSTEDNELTNSSQQTTEWCIPTLKQILKQQKNNICVGCGAENVDFALMYCACFACQTCKQKFESTNPESCFIYSKAIKDDEIWNDFQLKCLEMGGNQPLLDFMEENQITSIDFTNLKFISYIKQQINYVLKKEHIEHLKKQIANISEILRIALTKFEDAINKDIILAIGNTGSGKSTMFTSLIYGTEFLKEDKQPYEILKQVSLGDFKKKIKYNTVIIQKKEKEQILNGKFEIGHDGHRSKTFIPHFETDQKLDLVYADIAGLKDVNDEIIDVLNKFLTKSLFIRAKSVRFIITITYEQIMENRGQQVREQIQTVREICHENLDHLIKSLQPVLTKVDKKKFKLIALDQIKSALLQILEQELQRQVIENPQLQEDKEEYLRHQNFYNEFANKLVIFDPLDRPIPKESENQALKQHDFVNALNQLEPITTRKLLYPLDQKHIDAIEDEFLQYFKEVIQISNEYVEIARVQKKEFNLDFANEPRVATFLKICEIFGNNRLIEYKKCQDNLKKREYGQNCLDQIRDLIEQTNTNCQRIKQIAIEMNDEQQKLSQRINEMTGKQIIKDFEWIVVTIIEFKQNIDVAQQQLTKNQIEQGFEELTKLFIEWQNQAINSTLSKIAESTTDLIQFAYYLRFHDKLNLYSNDLLEPLIPSKLLLKIIMNNRWNNQKNCLVVDENFFIRLSIGQNYNGVLKYSTKDDGSLIQLQIFDQNAKNAKNFNDCFSFLLTKYGFEIGNFTKGLKLCSEKGEVTSSHSQLVIWCDKQCQNYKNPKAGYWQLIKPNNQDQSLQDSQEQQDDNIYLIGMNYGDNFPRLVSKPQYDKSGLSTIIVSTKYGDNIYNPKYSHWKLEEIDIDQLKSQF